MKYLIIEALGVVTNIEKEVVCYVHSDTRENKVNTLELIAGALNRQEENKELTKRIKELEILVQELETERQRLSK